MAKTQLIAQGDVRILREALANLAKSAQRTVQVVALDALTRFAEAIRPYCEHIETVLVAKENKNACLDCGARLDPTSTN